MIKLKELLEDETEVSEADLTGYNTTIEIGDEGCKALSRWLQSTQNTHHHHHNHHCTLTSLKLDINNIGAEGIKHLVAALDMNTTLQALYLSENRIGLEGIKILASALATNSINALHTLVIDKNDVGGSEGIKHLADALYTNTTLHVLNLNSVKMGDVGAKWLAKSLMFNATLSYLDVGCNEIGAAGAKAISLLLNSNVTLRTLILSSNRMGTLGTKYIANAIAANRTLFKLVYDGNNTNDEGATYFLNAIEFNDTPRSLYLSDQPNTHFEYALQVLIHNRLRYIGYHSVWVQGKKFKESCFKLTHDLSSLNCFILKSLSAGQLKYVFNKKTHNFSVLNLIVIDSPFCIETFISSSLFPYVQPYLKSLTLLCCNNK